MVKKQDYTVYYSLELRKYGGEKQNSNHVPFFRCGIGGSQSLSAFSLQKFSILSAPNYKLFLTLLDIQFFYVSRERCVSKYIEKTIY